MLRQQHPTVVLRRQLNHPLLVSLAMRRSFLAADLSFQSCDRIRPTVGRAVDLQVADVGLVRCRVLAGGAERVRCVRAT